MKIKLITLMLAGFSLAACNSNNGSDDAQDSLMTDSSMTDGSMMEADTMGTMGQDTMGTDTLNAPVDTIMNP